MNKKIMWIPFWLCFLCPVLQAQMQTIDFEDLAGPSLFSSADPPLHKLLATFSGGQLLRNATNGPADESTVYGTAYACAGCKPTITLDFSQKVAAVSLFLLNGDPFQVTYTVEDDDGTTRMISLPPNLVAGAATVTLDDQNIRQVLISGNAGSQWDFAIDDVSYTPQGAVLVDPVPGGLLSGPAPTTNTGELAASSDVVKGLSADGSTRVVLRIPAKNPGQAVMIAVINDHGAPSSSTDEDGGLAPLGGAGPWRSVLSVAAVSTPSGPMAFAVYLAPGDFSRGAADNAASTRHVTLQVTPSGASASASDVLILRPPVVLIHGLWGRAEDWKTFTTLTDDTRFYVRRVDYSGSVGGITGSTPSYPPAELAKVTRSSLGFAYNAPTVAEQLTGYLIDFRHDNSVAAVQADVVAHSMGGDIARTVAASADFQDYDTYGRGPIHKLVTIGTPHLGSPLAIQMVEDANSCVRGVLGQRFSLTSVTFPEATVTGGVGDLAGDGRGADLSPALQGLPASAPFPTAYIAGTMGNGNLSALDCTVCAAFAIRQILCPHDPLANDLTPEGWPGVFGQDSDAIVPLTSQLRNGQGITVPGVIHSPGVTSLSFAGPSELENKSQIPSQVIMLLNEKSSGADFRR